MLRFKRKRFTSYSSCFFAPQQDLRSIASGMLLFSHHFISTDGMTPSAGRLSTAVVMAMTFGYDFRPENEHDRFVELAEETSSGIASLFLPGSTLINVLPFLRHIPPWVPGAITQRFAAHLSESMNAYRTEPFEYVERDLVSVPLALLRAGLE